MKKLVLSLMGILLIASFSQAQQNLLDEARSLASNIKVDNNRLVFNNQAEVESIYNRLEELISNYVEPNLSEQEQEDLFLNGREVETPLTAFEEALGFTSLRKKEFIAENNFLLAGGDPDRFVESYVIDPIYQTLLSSTYTMKVGSDIYFDKTANLTLIVIGGDEGILTEVMNGQLFNQSVVKAISRGGDCGLDFDYSYSYFNSYSGSFELTGNVPTDAKILWEFGDGTRDDSNKSKITKTYDAPGGLKYVCVTISTPTCYQVICKYVAVNLADKCTADFKVSEGPNLIINFESKSFPGAQGTIIKWEWDFGDGSPKGYGKSITHTFKSACKFPVSLTITSQIGKQTCTDTKVMEVTPKELGMCCDPDLDRNETEFKHIITVDEHELRGHSFLSNTWIGKDKVVAYMASYKKTKLLGWIKKGSEELKAEIEGNMYEEEASCPCKTPIDISGSDQTNSGKSVEYKRKVSNEAKTNKKDPWKSHFYHKGNRIKTIITPVAGKGC